MAFAMTQKEAWIRLKEGSEVDLRKMFQSSTFDRTESSYTFTFPDRSAWIHTILPNNLSKLSKKWKGRKLFLVCPMGIRTRTVAEFLQDKGVEAYSIKGGATEWSALNLPRWRPDICNIKDEMGD